MEKTVRQTINVTDNNIKYCIVPPYNDNGRDISKDTSKTIGMESIFIKRS
ncbi:hypothetical protein LA52FAK_38040 [Desulforhopalus sp. 52FAK]